MGIDSKIPEIATLRQRIRNCLGTNLNVHSDFVGLRDSIFNKTKELISETTLERLWNYSTRGYGSVSQRTLDVLCSYLGFANWDSFVKSLREENGCESDIFDQNFIISSDLRPGDSLRIGWQPDRICTIRYIGENKFVALETKNSKLKPGDTFLCLKFQLHSPLYLENLTSSDGELKGARYGVGLRNGLSMLQILDQ